VLLKIEQASQCTPLLPVQLRGSLRPLAHRPFPARNTGRRNTAVTIISQQNASEDVKQRNRRVTFRVTPAESGR
jgi:hypothetical protein